MIGETWEVGDKDKQEISNRVKGIRRDREETNKGGGNLKGKSKRLHEDRRVKDRVKKIVFWNVAGIITRIRNSGILLKILI